MKFLEKLAMTLIAIVVVISIEIMSFSMYSSFRSEYVDNRCREQGYEWGTYHETTFKSFCYGKKENGYGYIPFEDAIK